jgi:hypothetical protein
MTDDGRRHQYMPIVMSGFAYETTVDAAMPDARMQVLR